MWYGNIANLNTLFGANENVNIIEVKKGSKTALLGFSADPDSLHHTSWFGNNANALAAINGTFFDVKNGGSVDFVRINGKTVNNNRINKQRARHQRAAVAIQGRKLKIIKWNDKDNWEDELAQPNVMNSGPLLIYKKKDEYVDTAGFNVLRHPRSCLIITRKSVLLVTVDGRNAESAGMSLFELRRFSRWLGANDAINFDGGGSTALWINGKPDNGVVNCPSDNKKFDHFGERKVANVLFVKTKK
jgi:exopolysaccharide biosynthesis protein